MMYRSLKNDIPFTLFGGINVLESRDLAFRACEQYVEVTRQSWVSPTYSKPASIKPIVLPFNSYRGPGLEEGLRIFEDIKKEFNVPIITDVHETWQAAPVAEVVDILQLPAFLARQTDLVVALAKTGKPINVKETSVSEPSSDG